MADELLLEVPDAEVLEPRDHPPVHRLRAHQHGDAVHVGTPGAGQGVGRGGRRRAQLPDRQAALERLLQQRDFQSAAGSVARASPM